MHTGQDSCRKPSSCIFLLGQGPGNEEVAGYLSKGALVLPPAAAACAHAYGPCPSPTPVLTLPNTKCLLDLAFNVYHSQVDGGAVKTCCKSRQQTAEDVANDFCPDLKPCPQFAKTGQYCKDNKYILKRGTQVVYPL